MFSPGHRTKRDPGDEAASIRVRHKANRNVDYTGAPPQLFPNQRRTKQLTKLVFRRPSPKSLQHLSNNNWILSCFKIQLSRQKTLSQSEQSKIYGK